MRSSPALRDPDLLLLQEMDEAGTRHIAEGLGMAWVYYPSTVHRLSGRDFGCAILSRLPMQGDRKIMLPHASRFHRMRRAAVTASIDVRGRLVQVFNVHLATMVENGPRQRREQLEAILDDAGHFDRVILAGDFNSPRIPGAAVRYGYAWPTRRIGPTNAIWAMDHVLLKGLSLHDAGAFGSVRDSLGASDHKPVWVRVSLPHASRT